MDRLKPSPWQAQNAGPVLVIPPIDMLGGIDGADLFVDGLLVRRAISAKDAGPAYQRARWEANETAIEARRMLARTLRARAQREG
jgi:hypothetical protein